MARNWCLPDVSDCAEMCNLWKEKTFRQRVHCNDDVFQGFDNYDASRLFNGCMPTIERPGTKVTVNARGQRSRRTLERGIVLLEGRWWFDEIPGR